MADPPRDNTIRRRQEMLEGRVHELTVQVSVLAEQVSGMREKLGALHSDVQGMVRRPGRWMDTLISALIGAISAGLIGFLITGLTKG
nr:hypothetical protein [bacterium]